MTRRVVVIGGTGAFGARLVEGLIATTSLAVVIAARRNAPAQDLAAALRARYPQRTIETCMLDTARIVADDLRVLDAWCVVDAAGPFQGAAPRVAEAAIAAGCHYVDIADARDFVAAFPRLDAAARAARVLAVTGASSTPGVTQAVVDALVRGWHRIDDIEVDLSPGNRQPRGLSVVKSILAGAGQTLRIFRHGAWTTAHGMDLLVRRRMPGLGRRWLFLIDTPDLDLLPQRFAPRRSALWRAGLELGVLHVGVWALSRLVVMRLLPSLRPLAASMRAMAEWFRRFGSGRGGMTVTVRGIDAAGHPVEATWALVAEQDGPNIPILPALAIVRALAEGRLDRTGALPCAGMFTLADLDREFSRFRIVTRTMVRPLPVMPRVLGREFARLPDAIRRGHLVDGTLLLAGRGSVDGAASLLGRILAWIIGLPATAADVPVTVEIRADAGGETWTRRFGTATFQSRLAPVCGRRRSVARARRAVTERFGLLSFDLALTATDAGLDLDIVGGRIGPLPLPRFLLPRSHASERVDTSGRFCFDVPVSIPGIGRVVHYRGWLVPSAASAPVDASYATAVAAK